MINQFSSNSAPKRSTEYLVHQQAKRAVTDAFKAYNLLREKQPYPLTDEFTKQVRKAKDYILACQEEEDRAWKILISRR